MYPVYHILKTHPHVYIHVYITTHRHVLVMCQHNKSQWNINKRGSEGHMILSQSKKQQYKIKWNGF